MLLKGEKCYECSCIGYSILPQNVMMLAIRSFKNLTLGVLVCMHNVLFASLPRGQIHHACFNDHSKYPTLMSLKYIPHVKQFSTFYFVTF